MSLNCAWTPIDLATLQLHHIVKKGDKTYIVKPREKTNILGCWRLWDEVAFALDRYILRHRDEITEQDFVLKTGQGNPLSSYKEIRDENGHVKLIKKDRTQSVWRKLWKRIGQKKHFRHLRKTSASAIERAAKDHRFVQQHLAHSPATLAGKVYTDGVLQEELDLLILDLPHTWGIKEHLRRLAQLYDRGPNAEI